MGFTATGAQRALQNLINGTWFLGFSTTTPTADGADFTEPSGGGYARTKLSASAGQNVFKVSASGHALTNDVNIYMPEPTASWGTLTHFGLFQSASATTPDYVGELKNDAGQTGGVTVNAGYIFFIRQGELEITLDATA